MQSDVNWKKIKSKHFFRYQDWPIMLLKSIYKYFYDCDWHKSNELSNSLTQMFCQLHKKYCNNPAQNCDYKSTIPRFHKIT